MVEDTVAREVRWQRLEVELMAGSGPDVIITSCFALHDLHRFAQTGMLRDIYELIDDSQASYRGDFFQEALRAFEAPGGRLYTFPASFGLIYVGVNSDLPQSYVERFSGMEMLTLPDMMDFKMDFYADYGLDFGHLIGYDMGSVSHHDIVTKMLKSFVDISERRSFLDSEEFIALLEQYRDFYHVWRFNPYRILPMGTCCNTQGALRDRAVSQVLNAESLNFQPANAFLETYTQHFSHHIPIADHSGRLIINTALSWKSPLTWAAFSVSASADGDIAWQFIHRFLVDFSLKVTPSQTGHGIVNNWGGHSFGIPIIRNLFPGHMRRTFDAALDDFYRREEGGHAFIAGSYERSASIGLAIQRISAYLDLPMVTLASPIPRQLYEDALEQFLHGTITAETAATRIHSAITLWLMETS
jgi:hypothetical protein